MFVGGSSATGVREGRDTPPIEPSAEQLQKEMSERVDYYAKLAEYHSAQAHQHAAARRACQAALESFNQKMPSPDAISV